MTDSPRLKAAVVLQHWQDNVINELYGYIGTAATAQDGGAIQELLSVIDVLEGLPKKDNDPDRNVILPKDFFEDVSCSVLNDPEPEQTGVKEDPEG